jgi:hypothetical protein
LDNLYGFDRSPVKRAAYSVHLGPDSNANNIIDTD